MAWQKNEFGEVGQSLRPLLVKNLDSYSEQERNLLRVFS